MNKAQLVEAVSDKTGITKKKVGNVMDAVIKTITGALSQGEKITLVGFGTFQVRQREARKGINPQTGQTMQIPAKKVPKFRPGKELREAVE